MDLRSWISWSTGALAWVSLPLLLVGGCKKSSPRPDQAATQAQLAEKLAGAQPGEEREIQPGTFMTMFRSQATEGLPDGWHVATSTKGGFSVEMPLPFNDFRMRTTEDQVEVVMDAVGAKSPGLLSWSATCIVRADGTVGPRSGPKPTNARGPIGSPVKAWQRTIVAGPRACILVVEAQGTDPLPSETDIQRFLGSFKEVR